ncbi:hypothetical protein IW140_000256 [Coemansia sp. RSA 1813]|nr:hypothetical protein IW140_000256 [Coemansia sp. RSA 1813]
MLVAGLEDVGIVAEAAAVVVAGAVVEEAVGVVVVAAAEVVVEEAAGEAVEAVAEVAVEEGALGESEENAQAEEAVAPDHCVSGGQLPAGHPHAQDAHAIPKDMKQQK